MLENQQVVTGQQHAGAAAETESRHPTHPTEPPAHFGRTQLIALAVFIGVPVLLYLLLERV